VRWISDRLQQFARVSGFQAQPQPRDTEFEAPSHFVPIVEVPEPVRFGGPGNVGAFATGIPFQESFLLHDVVDVSGVAGLDSRTLVTLSPGLWNIHLHKGFEFTGTTNQAKDSRLRIVTLSPDLGTVVFTWEQLLFRYVSGARRDVVRDMQLPMLAPFSITVLSSATVALDELHHFTSIVARRFF